VKNENAPDRLARLRRRYSALCEQLSTKALVLNGSLTPRSTSLWRWTRKLKTRTISQYLPEAAAADFRRAIANHRRLERILAELRRLSELILLTQHDLQPPAKRPKTPLS
jgi:hypothetical protein